MYYIMRATQAVFNKNRVSLEEIQKELGGERMSVLVVRRLGNDTAGKYRKTFISGHGHGYEDIVGQECRYTQDTGNGYANKNQSFIVENVIEYVNGTPVKVLNDIGLNETRSVWVMK